MLLYQQEHDHQHLLNTCFICCLTDIDLPLEARRVLGDGMLLRDPCLHVWDLKDEHVDVMKERNLLSV